MVLELLKMLGALPAQVIRDPGKPVNVGLAAFHLAVENPQGVRLSPPAAIIAEPSQVLTYCLFEYCDETGPAVTVPNGVYEKSRFDLELFQKPEDHLDHLRLDGGIVRSQDLRANLVKLPPAPFLLLLMTKHRPDIVKFCNAAAPVHMVLCIGPNHRRRDFRTQGDRSSSLVGKRVHLLAHDVRVAANAASEELCRLEQWGPDFLKPVKSEHLPRSVFNQVPARDLNR